MKLALVHSVKAHTLGGMERALLGLAGIAAARGDRVSVVCRPGADFGAAARSRGLDVEEMALRGEFDLFSARSLRSGFVRNSVEVALVTLHRDARLCGLARAGLTLPAIALVKGIPLGRGSWLRALTYERCVDGVITPTRWLRDDCMRYDFFKNVPVRVLPDGIDTAQFPPLGSLAAARAAARKALEIPASRTLFFSAGHLVGNKNFAALPARLAALDGRADWEWWLAGDGDQAALVRAAARAAGVEGRIRLLGRRGDVPSLLLAADALLVPSFKEQLPLIALEALRAGVPAVIVSAVGAMDEMRALGIRLVPATDERAWNEALSAAAASPAGTREPPEWGRDLQACALARLDFLQELLATRRRTA